MTYPDVATDVAGVREAALIIVSSPSGQARNDSCQRPLMASAVGVRARAASRITSSAWRAWWQWWAR